VIFAPFVFFWVVVFAIGLAIFFTLVEIHIISYAFQMIGLPPEMAFLALMASLIGSYVNIPITQIECVEPHAEPMVRSFGVAYRIPMHYAHRATTVAVNVGGAVVPCLITLYLLIHWPGILMHAAIATAAVALIVNRSARPVPGLGIATPMFVAPIAAALAAILLTQYGGAAHRDAIAYASGVMGTLIGADLMNLGSIGKLGAPVASIGGAGTFDGIFLTGIVAVLLA
jgi:uncharacterized membrane protein